MSAEQHWRGLDRAFCRVLPAGQVAHARERFARRASALSDIVLPRLLHQAEQALADDSDSTSKLARLRQISRELSAALSVSWAEGEDAFRKL